MSGKRNSRNPFEGFFQGDDSFGDPFFSDFQQQIDNIFHNFHDFGINDDTRYNNISNQNSNHSKGFHRGADLSAIIPNSPINETLDNTEYNKNDDNMVKIYIFEPKSHASDNYTLSDINPNIPNVNGPITHEHHPGFVEKRGIPPGFHNPYFPGYHGAEKPMDFSVNQNHRSFSRSQSVIIQRNADGTTTKTTTIRDGNGPIQTITEVYDNDSNDVYFNNEFQFGQQRMIRSMIETLFGMKSLDMNSTPNPNQKMFPIKADEKLPKKDGIFSYEQISADPLLRIRNFWNRWKPKFKNSSDMTDSQQPKGKNESWFWGNTGINKRNP